MEILKKVSLGEKEVQVRTDSVHKMCRRVYCWDS
jgi:hypothetical protein